MSPVGPTRGRNQEKAFSRDWVENLQQASRGWEEETTSTGSSNWTIKSPNSAEW